MEWFLDINLSLKIKKNSRQPTKEPPAVNLQLYSTVMVNYYLRFLIMANEPRPSITIVVGSGVRN